MSDWLCYLRFRSGSRRLQPFLHKRLEPLRNKIQFEQPCAGHATRDGSDRHEGRPQLVDIVTRKQLFCACCRRDVSLYCGRYIDLVTWATGSSTHREEEVPLEKRHADTVLHVVESWGKAVVAQNGA